MQTEPGETGQPELDAMHVLRENLRKIRAAMPWQAGWPFNSNYDMVLRAGREFEWQPLPTEYEVGMPKQCFTNTFKLVMMHRRDLTYCEGYICREWAGSIAIEHAWAVDNLGRVVESTIRLQPGEKPVVYMGFPFDWKYVIEMYTKKDNGCVLDAYKLKWPLLSGKQKIERVVDMRHFPNGFRVAPIE